MEITMKLKSPLTEVDWNKITDAELEHTPEIEFTTPTGRKVRYRRVDESPRRITDYISRAAAIEEARYRQHFYEGHRDYDFAEAFELMGDRLEDLPAADVKPVVHGKWTIEPFDTYELSYGTTAYEPVYRCSACGRSTESYLRLDEPIMPEDADFPKFCPNCGADMRGNNNG